MVNNMENRLKNFFDKSNIIKFIYFMVGVTILSTVYNAVLMPFNIVTGGVSGLAIIVKQITGVSTTIFIDIANSILIVVSFLILGKKDTLRQILGCIIYPVMVTITGPFGKFLFEQIEFSLLFLIIVSIVHGIGNGLVYRAGYSTGGFDILTTILAKKIKKAITQTGPILNMCVIIFGAFIFKPTQIMCALLFIFISNRVTNVVLFSISRNKMVFVISNKGKDISKKIMKDMHMGTTEIKVHSGLFERKKQMIMCIVHNNQYAKFKHEVLKLDKSAFILANNCYQVSGGMRYTVLPF